jgi:hypothetical protein
MKKFKYKCETLTCYMCVSIYTNKCNMQHLNNGFNKLKTDDSSHVNMLIVQEMCSNLLKHPNIIAKHWVTYGSIYFSKCKMQLVSDGFNIINVNGLTHVHMLIIEKMWKQLLIHSNINARS